MNHTRKVLLFIGLVLLLLLSACEYPPAAMADEGSENPLPEPTATFTIAAPEEAGTQDTPNPQDEEDQEPSQTPTPTFTPEPEVIGPDYQDGYNPLTGMLEDNPLVLFMKPLMVAISNFPPSARPQFGLSVASQVWETYIGEGATRFLVIFYGDYVTQLQGIMQNRLDETFDQLIKPIRSGRVVFEDIKTMYPGALLITAGASPEVSQQLSNQQNYFGSNPDDINGAGLGGDDLSNLSGATGNPVDYASLMFGPATGGSPADFLRIIYNVNNHVGWEYDPESGAYLRYQDIADGTGDLYPATDGLTGEQLAFENVVVMWAQHNYVKPTLIEIELLYVKDRKGLLFRDGEVYEILWSSMSGELKIYDANGNVVPLKPGDTFFEVVSYASTWKPEEMLIRFH
ncbi:MAG: DUF3048 C-terminal domain-containing protein [Anaerolineales bacterium]|nr:DUF3048 C-terminal domain-containing protein [Anaerolineales bacterium]